jgi:hypothetical protein
MDFTLIPLCSDTGHEFSLNRGPRSHCDICDRVDILHHCANCEYSICKHCYKAETCESSVDTVVDSSVDSVVDSIVDSLVDFVVDSIVDPYPGVSPKMEPSRNLSDRDREIKNDILLAKYWLKKDGLLNWSVVLGNDELCYINESKQSRTYDYPKCVPPSPEQNLTLSPISEISERSERYPEQNLTLYPRSEIYQEQNLTLSPRSEENTSYYGHSLVSKLTGLYSSFTEAFK